jgi:hypothetical protein
MNRTAVDSSRTAIVPPDMRAGGVPNLLESIGEQGEYSGGRQLPEMKCGVLTPVGQARRVPAGQARRP